MIVLLSGRKRSGKDSASTILCDLLKFERYAFADPIKVACKEIFLLDDAQIDGSTKEDIDPRWGISPRRIYQLFGTDLMRERLGELDGGYRNEVGEALWVKRFIEWYRLYPMDYVITDCRFLNELDMVRTYFDDVVSIRIERDSIDKSDSHPSESGIDSLPVDYVVENNGTISDLQEKVYRIVVSEGGDLKEYK